MAYSYCTGEPRGIGDKKPLKSGTNFLTSVAVAARLENTTDDAEGDDANCRAFLRRYYAHCNIWDTYGDELEYEKEKLMDQLYIDICNRNSRKTGGDRLILWAATFLAASVSLISFIRNIAHNQNSNSDTVLAINYAEGAGALFVLILTQITNRKTQADDLATKALIKVRKWAKDYVQARHQGRDLSNAAQSMAPAALSIETLMPIEDALHNLRYQTQQTRNLDHSLLEAVSRLRTKLGVHTTLKQVHDSLQAFIKHSSVEAHLPLSSGGETAAPKTKGNSIELNLDNINSLATIELLSRLYDCPIFVISETPFSDDSYCRMINETLPADIDMKEAEGNPEAHQQDRERRTMILYTPATNHDYYQAVHTPITMGVKRPFADIKAELSALKPSPRPTHTLNETPINHLNSQI
ncbi:MAG: hypothetical protein P1U61_02495 [Legionellaceae bacterium]|nr:hypothetical protein [Legionellaceae bacterium]